MEIKKCPVCHLYNSEIARPRYIPLLEPWYPEHSKGATRELRVSTTVDSVGHVQASNLFRTQLNYTANKLPVLQLFFSTNTVCKDHSSMGHKGHCF